MLDSHTILYDEDGTSADAQTVDFGNRDFFTTSGDSRMLVIGAAVKDTESADGNDGDGNDLSMSFGGQDAVLLDYVNVNLTGNQEMSLFYILNPSADAANFTVNVNSKDSGNASEFDLILYSLTGAAQTAPNVNSQQSDTSPVTTSVTAPTDGTFALDFLAFNNGDFSNELTDGTVVTDADTLGPQTTRPDGGNNIQMISSYIDGVADGEDVDFSWDAPTDLGHAAVAVAATPELSSAGLLLGFVGLAALLRRRRG